MLRRCHIEIYRVLIIFSAIIIAIAPYGLLRASMGQALQVQSTIPESAEVGRVRSALLKRQQSIQSASFEWREERVSRPHHVLAEGIDFEPIEMPQFSSKLVTDGMRFRYETDMLSLDNGAEVATTRLITAFDGLSNQTFQPNMKAYPIGRIESGPQFRELSTIALQPLLLYLRPISSGAIDLSERAQIRIKRTEHNGTPCVAIESEVTPFPDASPETRIVFADSERGFLPLAFHYIIRGKVIAVIDLEYRLDAIYGSVPASWNFTLTSTAGALQEAARASVTNYEINKPISESTFTIQFPPGTQVVDKRDGETYEVPRDGSGKSLKPDELPVSGSSWSLVVVASVILACMFLGWLCTRRIRQIRAG